MTFHNQQPYIRALWEKVLSSTITKEITKKKERSKGKYRETPRTWLKLIPVLLKSKLHAEKQKVE